MGEGHVVGGWPPPPIFFFFFCVFFPTLSLSIDVFASSFEQWLQLSWSCTEHAATIRSFQGVAWGEPPVEIFVIVWPLSTAMEVSFGLLTTCWAFWYPICWVSSSKKLTRSAIQTEVQTLIWAKRGLILR